MSAQTPILVAVDPFREDPDPLELAAVVLAGLTGRPLVAIGAYPSGTVPNSADVPTYRQAVRDLALQGLGRTRDRLPRGH